MVNQMTTNNIILVVLKSTLEIVQLNDLSHKIILDGQEFTKKIKGDFLGFYDWLKNKEGNIIGLRYFLFEDYQFIIDDLALLHVNYLEIDSAVRYNSILYIYFSEEKDFIDKVSNDQLFGDNCIYKSELGEYAITFCLPDKMQLNANQ